MSVLPISAKFGKVAVAPCQWNVNVAVGALERCTNEYQFYIEEKASLVDKVFNLIEDSNTSAWDLDYRVKKTGELIQETKACLQGVGNSIQCFYEMIKSQRDYIGSLDSKIIKRVNKAMKAAGVIGGDEWEAIMHNDFEAEK